MHESNLQWFGTYRQRDSSTVGRECPRRRFPCKMRKMHGNCHWTAYLCGNSLPQHVLISSWCKNLPEVLAVRAQYGFRQLSAHATSLAVTGLHVTLVERRSSQSRQSHPHPFRVRPNRTWIPVEHPCQLERGAGCGRPGISDSELVAGAAGASLACCAYPGWAPLHHRLAEWGYFPHDTGYLSQSLNLTDKSAILPFGCSVARAHDVPGWIAAPHSPEESSKATTACLVAANRILFL